MSHTSPTAPSSKTTVDGSPRRLLSLAPLSLLPHYWLPHPAASLGPTLPLTPPPPLSRHRLPRPTLLLSPRHIPRPLVLVPSPSSVALARPACPSPVTLVHRPSPSSVSRAPRPSPEPISHLPRSPPSVSLALARRSSHRPSPTAISHRPRPSSIAHGHLPRPSPLSVAHLARSPSPIVFTHRPRSSVARLPSPSSVAHLPRSPLPIDRRPHPLPVSRRPRPSSIACGRLSFSSVARLPCSPSSVSLVLASHSPPHLPRPGFIAPLFRDNKIPVMDHLHVHGYVLSADLMGWWHVDGYSAVAWYDIDDLIAAFLALAPACDLSDCL
ncbi:hypothetical protein LXA43DRAFT_1151165 [Ganoderma leucocontextum]|nr:hypothetical protein LXA43DRAFT_1151165 [Ganoderma leucocontextum]